MSFPPPSKDRFDIYLSGFESLFFLSYTTLLSNTIKELSSMAECIIFCSCHWSVGAQIKYPNAILVDQKALVDNYKLYSDLGVKF